MRSPGWGCSLGVVFSKSALGPGQGPQVGEKREISKARELWRKGDLPYHIGPREEKSGKGTLQLQREHSPQPPKQPFRKGKLQGLGAPCSRKILVIKTSTTLSLKRGKRGRSTGKSSLPAITPKEIEWRENFKGRTKGKKKAKKELLSSPVISSGTCTSLSKKGKTLKKSKGTGGGWLQNYREKRLPCRRGSVAERKNRLHPKKNSRTGQYPGQRRGRLTSLV